MKIHDVVQGSHAWLKLRAGIPTASEFGRLITPHTWKARTSDGPTTYLCEKLAEAFTGMPLPQVGGFGALEQGTILEEEALPYYELATGATVQRVGFITTDDGRIGCSPDGLLGDNRGIEIKCPAAHTHVRYLLDGGVPVEYLPQIHGGLLVTGRQSWEFVSYRRGFPAVRLVVRRDEKIQAALRQALDSFLARFDAALHRLREVAGSGAAGASSGPPTGEHRETEGGTARSRAAQGSASPRPATPADDLSFEGEIPQYWLPERGG